MIHAHASYRETSQPLCRLMTIKLGKCEFSYGRSTAGLELQRPALDFVSRGLDVRLGGVNVLCSLARHFNSHSAYLHAAIILNIILLETFMHL